MTDVTAIVVFCCTEELVRPCLDSFRSFYPDIRLIVIDNSRVKEQDHCLSCTEGLKEYCKTDSKTELYIMPWNIGHGNGLAYGMLEVRTKYAYIFESDTEHFRAGLIENMVKRVTDHTYGVGRIVHCTYANSYACSPYNAYNKERKTGRVMKMLWLYSSIIVVKKYFEFPPFDDCGGTCAGPLRKSAQAISDDGNPLLYVKYNVDNFVIHHGGGTRISIGIPNIESQRIS